MINTKLQNIIDTKSAIGNAIVNKGGTITSETPFFNYAAQIDGISTGSVLTGNATANQVFNGQTFYSNDANTQLTGNYVAPQIDGYDEGKMFFVKDTSTNEISSNGLAFNNGYLYVTTSLIRRYYETNLTQLDNSANYGGNIQAVAINNGYIYVGGLTNQRVQKFYESNLVFVNNTENAYGTINAIAINNGYIYVGTTATNGITKYYEDNLAFVGNTATTNGNAPTISINNGFIYAGGIGSSGIRVLQKFYEDNLALVSNSGATGFGSIRSSYINNGLIFVGGSGSGVTNERIRAFYEDNLVEAYNSGSALNDITTIFVNNNSVYATGGNNVVYKFYESNLANLAQEDLNFATAGRRFIVANSYGYYITQSTLGKIIINTPFTNTLNGRAWYLVEKE